MSKSSVLVATGLFALGILVWLITGEWSMDGIQVAVDKKATSRVTVQASPALATSVPRGIPMGTGIGSGPPVRVGSREELLQALKNRGLNGEQMLAGYLAWRVARGFLGADPLAGVTVENAPAQVYWAMDRSTQKSLADAGDVGAMQAYAAGSLPGDVFTAVDYFQQASSRGSGSAMIQLANVLADIGALEMGDVQNDRPFADKLLALRNGDPDRDLRRDGVAWTLAAIRQYGPPLAYGANMDLVEGMGRIQEKGLMSAICGKSLGILASVSATVSGQAGPVLPPVFIAPSNLYKRLPCQDTPAPVTPPRELEACTASPALDSNNLPVDLWICPEY